MAAEKFEEKWMAAETQHQEQLGLIGSKDPQVNLRLLRLSTVDLMTDWAANWAKTLAMITTEVTFLGSRSAPRASFLFHMRPDYFVITPESSQQHQDVIFGSTYNDHVAHFFIFGILMKGGSGGLSLSECGVYTNSAYIQHKVYQRNFLHFRTDLVPLHITIMDPQTAHPTPSEGELASNFLIFIPQFLPSSLYIMVNSPLINTTAIANGLFFFRLFDVWCLPQDQNPGWVKIRNK
jgi:hypothetical protein